MLEVTSEVLAAVRRAKTEAKRSMRARVARLTVIDRPDRLESLRTAQRDLLEAGVIDPGCLVLEEGEQPTVSVELDGSS